MDPIRVLVVDDQPLFCAGMRLILEAEADLTCVGVAHDGVRAVQAAAELHPDVVLLDVRMPGEDGLDAAARITALDGPRVLMLTTFRTDAVLARAVKAGASGFVTKDAEPARLAAAIRTVHGGDVVVARRMLAPMLSDPDRRRQPDVEAIAALTPREREVFLHVARGRSNAEVATIAFLAETTVKTHVRGILGKLGLRSRLQIVAFAYEHGLLPSSLR